MKSGILGYIIIGLFVACVVVLSIRTCSKERERGKLREQERIYKEKHPFEKYVYLDTAGVLHRERNCVLLYVNAVQYYDTTRGFGYKPSGYCTNCFTTEQYEMFQKIEERARARNR